MSLLLRLLIPESHQRIEMISTAQPKLNCTQQLCFLYLFFVILYCDNLLKKVHSHVRITVKILCTSLKIHCNYESIHLNYTKLKCWQIERISQTMQL